MFICKKYFDKTEIIESRSKDSPNNKYSFLLEIEILNHLIRVKYDKSDQKENRSYAFVDELIKNKEKLVSLVKAENGNIINNK